MINNTLFSFSQIDKLFHRGISLSTAFCMVLACLGVDAEKAFARSEGNTDPVRSKVAILPITVEDDSGSSGETYTLAVRDLYAKSERLELTDREETGSAITDTSADSSIGYIDFDCLINTGESLDAEYALTGYVRRLGTKHLIELRLADVRKRELAALETGESSGDADELEETILDLAEKVLRRITNRPGVITVDTEPAESSIELDGFPVGFSPVHLERPGGTKYRVKAVRFGYKPVEKKVFLAEDDTLKLHFSLSIKPQKKETKALTRFWGSAGLPLNHSSSSFDLFTGFGKGSVFGGAASFGENWRIRFGMLRYSGILHDLDDSMLEDYGADGDPKSKAGVYYSALVYSRFNGSYGPSIGIGVGALDREITIRHQNGDRNVRSTQIEVGWLLELGMEIGISPSVSSLIEILHVNLIGRDASWQGEGEQPHAVWNESFKAFESFTALWLGIGYRF